MVAQHLKAEPDPALEAQGCRQGIERDKATPLVSWRSSSKPLWRDDTTHLVTSPLEFMQHLMAQVRRCRLHMAG
jgi:hypothetical protein